MCSLKIGKRTLVNYLFRNVIHTVVFSYGHAAHREKSKVWTHDIQLKLMSYGVKKTDRIKTHVLISKGISNNLHLIIQYKFQNRHETYDMRRYFSKFDSPESDSASGGILWLFVICTSVVLTKTKKKTGLDYIMRWLIEHFENRSTVVCFLLMHTISGYTK